MIGFLSKSFTAIAAAITMLIGGHVAPSPQPDMMATTTQTTQATTSSTTIQKTTPNVLVVIPGFRGLYARDSSHVYIGFDGNENRLIEKRFDPSTFQVIDQCYSKDSNGVLRNDWISESNFLTNADPKTFILIKGVEYPTGCPIYTADSTHVYAFGELIPGADPSTFRPINFDFSKDAKNLYYHNILISGIDLASFSTYGGDSTYIKDKNAVYYLSSVSKDSPIPTQVDVNTFAPTTNGMQIDVNGNVYDAADKNHKYYDGGVVCEDSTRKTCTLDEGPGGGNGHWYQN